jgi:3',5'-nucleoside bisphosphate phosphatase
VTQRQRLVDLHIHTTASDGSLTPTEVVAAASDADLSAIAVTDHDTVAGVPEALRAGRRHGIEVVPGLEISVEQPGSTMHMLAYFIDHSCAELLTVLARFREGRQVRNRRILERLAELGMPIEADAVATHAGGDTIGRPHIARAMVEAGHVPSIETAFRRWLARGMPAYVERHRATPEEAIRTILAAGGTAVLAHPKLIGQGHGQLRAIVERLAAVGLGGIEVWHPEHSAADTETFRMLAERFDLVPTGGTDFHGHLRRGVRLGVGHGNLRIDYDTVDRLRQCAARTGK